MTKWLDWLEERRPKFFAKIELQLLMNLTSRIFGQKSRCLWVFGPDKALRLYAQYTKELLLNHHIGDDESLQCRMRTEAYKLGRLLRRVTGLRNRSNLKRLVFILYKNIGIEMSGDIPGNIYVSRCYFSDFYDSKMCKVISGLDGGIISGLYGGGKLVFTERITEGCVCCKACFKQNKDVEK